MRSYIASNGYSLTNFSSDSAYIELREQQSVLREVINEVPGFQQFEWLLDDAERGRCRVPLRDVIIKQLISGKPPEWSIERQSRGNNGLRAFGKPR